MVDRIVTRAGGIRRPYPAHPDDVYDLVEGSKDELVETGIAEAHWFPTSPQLDKRGRTRRTFHFDGEHGRITLKHRGRDCWDLAVPLSPAQRYVRREYEEFNKVHAALELARRNPAVSLAQRKHLRLVVNNPVTLKGLGISETEPRHG